MSDIDFDELDKAVSSMGAGRAQPSPAAKVDVAAETSVAPSVPNPAVSAPQQTAPPASPPPVRRTAAARISRPVTRRGGFMDIVAKNKPVSRVARQVQPLGASLAAPASAPTEPSQSAAAPSGNDTPAPHPRSTAPMIAPSEPAATALPEIPAAPAAPQPEEFREPERAPVSQPYPLPTNESRAPAIVSAGSSFPDADIAEFAKAAQQPQDEQLQNQPEPAISPFLSDAKVQKRPLGAFASAAPEQPQAVTLAESAPSTPQDWPSQPSIAPAPAASAKPEIPAPPSAPEPLPSSELQLKQAATMAIPQQYHTSQQSADDTPRPVYDTGEYHPPLLPEHAHHAVHHGKIGMILALLTILTLLAVGGYLIFIYVTQGR